MLSVSLRNGPNFISNIKFPDLISLLSNSLLDCGEETLDCISDSKLHIQLDGLKCENSRKQ